ncbi:MAG TPA: energy transducer TonB, partial [Nevskiaceae bacterium]|nr:energy transducer TonB [Nevskiaceae bacterium]
KADAERKHQAEQQAAAAAAQAAAAQAAEAQRKEQERQAAARAASTVASAAPAAAKEHGPASAAKVDWTSCSQPSYPSASLRRREEGTVMMAFHIDPSGHVTGQRIDKSSGSPRLDQAAVDAIVKCRFMPAQADGEAVDSWASLRFVWKLDGG